MSSTPKNPTAMIFLASEQLWPNIHALIHWRHDLRRLCIYHTADERRSARPAHQLAALCRRLYPTVEVHLPEAPRGWLPDDVRRQIADWRRRWPGQRWLVNASGGNKLMYTGVLGQVGSPDVQRRLS